MVKILDKLSRRATIVKTLHRFQRAVGLILTVILAVVIALSTIHLAWNVIDDIIAPPAYLLDAADLFPFLGLFMTLVIAIELLDTVRVYFDRRVVKIEVVFLIAMMALAREVIVLDLHEFPGTSLLGVAAIICALSLGYFLFRRIRQANIEADESSQQEPAATGEEVKKKD